MDAIGPASLGGLRRGDRRGVGARRRVPLPASAAGDHGPLTCLDGYVWRQATPRDHVCVTPEVRAQTAQDNRLAPSRASATSTTFGPDLCGPGYVWREAVPGDHVCVDPGHLAAGPRRQPHGRRPPQRAEGEDRASTPPPGPTGSTPTASTSASRASRCSGPGRPGPRCRGPWSRSRSTKGPGGELSLDTRLPVCATPIPNAIVRVRDPSSLRWSSSRRIATGCASP